VSLQRPFIDTHVHFWDHEVDGLHWPWLEPGFSHRKNNDMATLDAPRYTVAEFLAEADGAGVEGIVHIQAIDGVEDYAVETAWLQQMSDRIGEPRAMIASCKVHEPDAVEVIERHARHARCVGVRDISTNARLDADAASAALSEIAARGWSLEARRHHDDFAVFEEIARRWPDLTLVMSHACLPLERTDADRLAWTLAAQRLAPYENIVCKISAVAGASDPDWTVSSIRPWILACVEIFGARRCMLGTNWPVDRLFGSYVDVVAAYREVIAELTDSDQVDLLSGTARRVYDITT
jgi:predicted TIM-barrel fold metal-dependent hydrolase